MYENIISALCFIKQNHIECMFQKYASHLVLVKTFIFKNRAINVYTATVKYNIFDLLYHFSIFITIIMLFSFQQVKQK